MSECWDKCIHSKACRRISKLLRLKGIIVGRNCNEDCTAYTPDNGETYITVEEALAYARDGVSSIRSGYGAYDVYCSGDLLGQTLKELVDDAEE